MLVPPSFLQANPEQPIFKQIQNYVFKFSDLIGQGNFSKVYKGKNKLTSTPSLT